MAQEIPPAFVTIDRDLVAAMSSTLSKQTKECVTETLGISWDTWTKIKRGGAIRSTTAERLLKRLIR